MTEMVARIDDLGRPAWIALMVVGFIVFWPAGLAILAFLLWSGRMGCGRNGETTRWQQRFAGGFERRMREWREQAAYRAPSTGNRAFDEYREATLRRLEEEAQEFRTFLEQLRMAKDRAEFDQFMAERKSRPGNGGTSTVPPTGPQAV